MENTIERIFEKISLIEKKDGYTIRKPGHIFTDLVNNFRNEISKKDLISLYYYMSISEKCLSDYRRGNIKAGNFNFLKINNTEEIFIEPIRTGMHSLHYALIAYKEYAEDNNKEALMFIQNAISNSLKQSDTFEYFSITIGEQTLNKIRVFAKNNDIKDAKLEYIKVLNLFVFGIDTDELTCGQKILNMDVGERYGMIQHIINGTDIALNKILNKKGKLDFYYDAFSSVLENSKKQTDFEDMLWTFSTVCKISNNEQEDWIEEVDHSFNKLKFAPKSLQKVVIENILSCCEEYYINSKTTPAFAESINYIGIN